jgi:hypothetical protein
MFNSAFGYGNQLRPAVRFLIAFFGFLLFPAILFVLIACAGIQMGYDGHDHYGILGYYNLCLLDRVRTN